MADDKTTRRVLRRHQLTALTDDLAARRVPVVHINPLRSATIQACGLMDRDPTLCVGAAIDEVFTRNDDLRVACAEHAIDEEAVEAGVVLMGETRPNLMTIAAQYLALPSIWRRFSGRTRVSGPAFEVQLPQRHQLTKDQKSKEDAMLTQVENESATERFVALARAERAANPKLSDDEAFGVASRKHRREYQDHVDSVNLTIDGRTVLGRDSSAAEDALGWKAVTFPTQPVKITSEKKKPTSAGGETVSAAWSIIESKIDEIMKAEVCSRVEAQHRALNRNPSFYDEYLKEFKRRTGGGYVAPDAQED